VALLAVIIFLGGAIWLCMVLLGQTPESRRTRKAAKAGLRRMRDEQEKAQTRARPARVRQTRTEKHAAADAYHRALVAKRERERDQT
jgi:hypothetical protein